jgi:hypothetical protein
MMFGCCFENAVSAYFAGEDSTATFFHDWRKYQDASLAYAKNDSWDRLYHQGVHLLERFAQDDRVRIARPKENLQVKLTRSFHPGANSFLTLMRSVNSTERNALSIGKRRPAAIRNSRRVCWHSIRN